MKTSLKKRSGGYVIILLTLLFISITLAIAMYAGAPILAHYSSSAGFVASKQAFGAAQAAADEALYRVKTGQNMPSTVNISLGTGSSTILTQSGANTKSITIESSQGNYQRDFHMDLVLGTGISFHYGIQSGNGGFYLTNSSSVTGNIFSSGSVIGSGNTIAGDVISAGASGLISGITATGTAYAHTIQNSTIQNAAHYMVIDPNTTVGGSPCPNANCYPNSSDLPTEPLPISDAQISQWESDAAAGGTASCSSGAYTISSDMSIGPLKIPCDLAIKNSTVTITGPIWVTGNIDIKGSTVQMSSSLNSQNVAIIADNPSNTTGSGIISVDTSSQFYAAGCPNSCVPGAYVFLISQNNSAETGGSTAAITPGQSSSGLITYASHGQINVGQSVHLKEVTAYKIVISNTANVTYDSGLGSSLFESGPGGAYTLEDWYEY
ncbi:MAG: hypothetical protein KGI45_00475 [Patescibacteria group bacterium]|nr:hypothetical protein [Patescibacteria group bacterium]